MTVRLVDRPERTFQLWAFTVGMARLLLRIETARGVGYVVAGVMVSAEDEGEYFEPSELWPDQP